MGKGGSLLMHTFKHVFIIGLLAAFFMAVPAASHAKIPIPVGFGEQISPVYDLPNDKFGGKDVGYMYNSFRVVYIPIITWGGKLVIYEGNEYGDLSKDEIKILEKEYGKMGNRVSLWIRSVNFLVFFILAVVAVFFVKAKLSE